MPTITLNKKEFEKLVGKKLPLEELKDRVSMLGTDLEKIEGNEIVVEVFPNRPDMLSEQGFARAFSSFIGVKPGLKEYAVSESGKAVLVEDPVKNVRPYTVCAIVKGLKFTDEKIREIIQIQEKLHVTHLRNRKKGAIGIYPMESIKFPIRYTALAPDKIKFQPLESNKEMTGLQILSQHPTGKDYAHLLEGKEMFPVFIDDNGEVLSMPPVINSHKTGRVSETTQDVFIECSGFDEKTLEACLNIIVTALADMGGELFSVDVEYSAGQKKYVLDLSPKEWDIDLSYVNKRLGLELDEKKLTELLAKMGFGYSKGKVLVPAYRADIIHQVDFIEDIAIAHGYENFVEEIPNVSTIGQEDNFEKFKRYASSVLAGVGLLECEAYHITNEDNLNTKMNIEMDFVSLANALTVDYSVMRSWLVPTLMEIFQKNKQYDYPQNIFTIGTCFKKDDSVETGVKEFTRVAVALCDKQADYTKVRQVLDYLLRMIGVEEYSVVDAEHGSFIPGRVARIVVNGKKVAYVGEVAPAVLDNWALEMPVAAFELNLTELFDAVNG